MTKIEWKKNWRKASDALQIGGDVDVAGAQRVNGYDAEYRDHYLWVEKHKDGWYGAASNQRFDWLEQRIPLREPWLEHVETPHKTRASVQVEVIRLVDQRLKPQDEIAANLPHIEAMDSTMRDLLARLQGLTSEAEQLGVKDWSWEGDLMNITSDIKMIRYFMEKWVKLEAEMTVAINRKRDAA